MPGPDAVLNRNIHVGLGNRGNAEQLVRGDAQSATWRIDVRVIAEAGGAFDYRGTLVQGPRGDRFIYLNWVADNDRSGLRLFRRGKVMLTDIDPALVREAIACDAELHADLNLTDEKGNPSCARFRPPAVTWSLVIPAAAGT
jgi:hypothetical protein